MIARKIQHDPILWHDGMMLTAQHFQQMSERFDEMISYHASLTTPYNWGVKTIKIDQELLAHGKLVVTEIEAIMPDGLIINNTKHNRIQLEHDLSINFSSDTKGMLDIYLYVPPKHKDTVSITTEQNRYNQIMPEIIDESSPYMEEVKIPYLTPNINLITTNEPPDIASSLRIGRLIFGNGLFRLDDYIPPLLTISRESTIWNVISAIVQRLRIKSLFLSKQISPSTIQHDPLILDKRLLQQCINTSIPELEILLNTPNISPFTFYLKLASVIGNISSLGYEMVPPASLNYNHNNLLDSFRQIKEMVFQIIDESIGDTYHAIPFNKEEGYFKLYMHSQWLNQPIIVGIQPRENKSNNDILKWMLNCVIGNIDDIKRFRKERTLGAQRTQIEKESTFPPSLDTVFFKIDPKSLTSDKELIIVNPSDNELGKTAESINLYVRRRTDI